MGGSLNGLFGSNTATNQQTQSQQSGTSQSNLFNDPRFQGALGSFFQQYSGPTINAVTTGPNAYQTAAADSLVGSVAPGGVAGSIAAAGLTPGMISSAMSPYIASVVQPTLEAMDTSNRAAVSDIRGGMGVRGSLGNNVGNIAAYYRGVQPQQQAQIAQLYNQGFGQATSTALQSLQARLAAAGQQQQGAGSLANVGEMIRAAGLQGSMLPFQLASQGAQGLAPWLQAAGNAFSGTSTGTSTGTSQTSPGIGNVIAGLVGAAMQFSDPAVKMNMREVGRTHDGQPLYVFNYRPGLGLPTHTQIGLDATDVASRDPGAVMDTPLGLAVNYDRALAPAAEPARRDGGGVTMEDKVARAFSLIQGMRKQAMRDGGVAPGYNLGGITSALGSLFPQTTDLGTSPGGWETSVKTPGFFGSDAAKGAGRALSGMTDRMGGLTGDPRAGGDPSRAGADALARQQADLSTMLRGLVSPSPREDGGRVGYQDGGDPEADVNRPQWGRGPGFSAAYEMPPVTADEVGPFQPSAPTGDALPRYGSNFGLGLGYRPGAVGGPEAGPTAAAAAPTRGLAPATALEPARAGPLDLARYSDTPPVAADINAPATPPRADPSWTPMVTREAAPPTPMGWGERLGRLLFPSWYGEGLYHGRQATPLQRVGAGLMAMSGPMVAGPWAQQFTQQQEVDIRNREAERQSQALEHQIQHQRDVLAETSRHHRAAEEHPAVRALIAAGFVPGSEEFRRQLIRILDKDRAETAFEVATSQASAKDAQERGNQIQNSRAQLQRLDQLEQLLSAPGVPQGRFANWELEGRRIAAGLFPGVGMEGIAEAEAANAITNQMALSLRSTADGAGMPGAMSDSDRVFLMSIPPGITRTPGGNQLMIRLMRETEQYRMAVNAEAVRYINSTRSNAGLQDHITRWMAANPMPSVVPTHAATRREAEAAIAAAPSPPGASSPAQDAVGTRREVDGVIYERQLAPDGSGRWVRVPPPVGGQMPGAVRG